MINRYIIIVILLIYIIKNIISKEKFTSDKIVPTLNFYSYNNCPVLYNLVNSFYNNILQTNLTGLRFKNKLISQFYNIEKNIIPEHEIININSFKGAEKFPDYLKKTTNFVFNTNKDYLIYNKHKEIYDQNIKHTIFDVKEDFTEDDIFKFVDYCYSFCCSDIINIENTSFLSNHYRVYPCECSKNSYYILPERIRKVVTEEKKNYTRAKCNECYKNIVIYFDEVPEKFKEFKLREIKADNNTNQNNSNNTNQNNTSNYLINDLL